MSANNILVTATHASYFIPETVRSKLALNERLLKNFSDFATRNIVQDIPGNICCDFSRAIGNPNQDIHSDLLFRDTDFNNIPVWKEPLTVEEKKELLDQFHKKYHDKIQKSITKLKPQLLVDVHDTGVWLLDINPKKDKKREFPEICLSNGEGTTCSDEIMFEMGALFKKHLDLTCTFNDPYQGGGVCRGYASQVPTIQIEFNRSLYMDEKTQEINLKKMNTIKEGFVKILTDLSAI